MYITNNTNYDNMTDDYNDALSLKNSCTDSDFKIDKIIPSLLLTTPCGLSFLCLIFFMVYTSFKPLLKK